MSGLNDIRDAVNTAMADIEDLKLYLQNLIRPLEVQMHRIDLELTKIEKDAKKPDRGGHGTENAD